MKTSELTEARLVLVLEKSDAKGGSPQITIHRTEKLLARARILSSPNFRKACLSSVQNERTETGEYYYASPAKYFPPVLCDIFGAFQVCYILFGPDLQSSFSSKFMQAVY